MFLLPSHAPAKHYVWSQVYLLNTHTNVDLPAC